MGSLSNHESLLARIRGQTVLLPDFKPILAKWETNLNPNYSLLRGEADTRLQKLITDPKKFKALKAANIERLVCTIFPHSAAAELRVMVSFMLWMHAWDDEMDHCDGLYTNDLAAAQIFCEDTLSAARFHLGLSESLKEAKGENKIIDALEEVGGQFREGYSREQCQLLYNELEYSINMARQEQCIHLGDEVPTLEKYEVIRLGTSAVGLTLACVEFMFRMRSPRDIMTDPSVRSMWDDANRVIYGANDILSMKKEIASDRVLNQVTLAFAECDNLQTSFDQAYESLIDDISNFDNHANAFLARIEHTAFEKEAKLLVQAYRDSIAGCLKWHFETTRFGLLDAGGEKGRISITL